MNTAQIIYEQYKVLPTNVKNELVALINKDNDEYVQVSLPSLVEGLQDLKQVLDGKKQGRDAREFLRELREDLANE